MTPFLISEARLAELSATRQGRATLSGFNFQAAYAVARLASMLVRRPILELPDFPTRVRYDWGEDLDEQCEDGRVIFTQCKRIATIGQPTGLASVLLSFAPKWLSVSATQRNNIRFRIVCTDPRFREGGLLSNGAASKEDARTRFVTALRAMPGDKSDRALWQSEADVTGHATLFEALWRCTDVLYLEPDVVTGLPASPLLPAEREALELLLTFSRVDASKQAQALGRLRRVIHDNLITFDPTNDADAQYPGQKPRVRDRVDVANALATCRIPIGANLPFEVVDRTFLSEQREAERHQFVARQPQWADVVHGADETVKFIERGVTDAMRSKVLSDLVEPMERGTDRRLHMFFVVGAPGSGKTTLVRRISAMLVDEGRIVVADAGIDVRDPIGSPDDYAVQIEKLANAGRPVIFLLDDPLYGDSPWIQILKRLNKPGLKVAVLAPCPQILFDRHRASLPFGVVVRQSIGPPTGAERAEMRRLYGRATDVLSVSEEFLVLTMEAAEGIPFDEIMRRLWLTLNDGKEIREDDSLEWADLAWTLRAFLVVCYFHRVDVTCPEPLLRTVLEHESSPAFPNWISNALARLRAQNGWMVFRLTEPLRNWAHQGTQIATAHPRIAQRAWEVRPLNWLEIGDKISRASVTVSQTVQLVGRLAARLQTSESQADTTFADRVVEQWLAEPHSSVVETRHLCDLTSALQANGYRSIAAPLAPLLRKRAEQLGDGWLAALQICYLSGDSLATQEFPTDLDLAATIEHSDFSIAPVRATKFHARLPQILRPAFSLRILAAFDGELGWRPDSFLITWLLGYGSPEGMLNRAPSLEVWLDNHPDDTSVRNGYLSLLSNQKLTKERLASVLSKTEQWLDNHPDDTKVRNGYLGLLSNQKLTKERLASVLSKTEQWLDNHPDDTHVRNGYLGLLSNQKLTKERLASVLSKTEQWLDNHPDDTHVRNGYLGLLSNQKLTKERLASVVTKTEQWLDNHLDDTNVRNGYLGLLSRQDLSSQESTRVRTNYESWLAAHPDDTHVRTALEAFVRSQNWYGDHRATTSLADFWPNSDP